jgi:hypothetical protein
VTAGPLTPVILPGAGISRPGWFALIR